MDSEAKPANKQLQSTQRHQKIDDSYCAAQAKESLKCLDKNEYDRSQCQELFEKYKACKKEEVQSRYERRLEERAKRGNPLW